MSGQIKLAKEDLEKLAQQEQFDREQAIELGFAKAAMVAGLDEDGFRTMYQVACNKIAETCEDGKDGEVAEEETDKEKAE